MTLTMLMFLLLTVLRAVLYVAMVAAAVRMMRDLGRVKKRRRANPAIHGALMMIAAAGSGLLLHTARLVLLQVADAGSNWYWLLLARDPDLVGEVASALAALLGAGGVVLLIRGARGVIFGESGELPPGLRPRKACDPAQPRKPEPTTSLRGLALVGSLLAFIFLVLDAWARGGHP